MNRSILLIDDEDTARTMLAKFLAKNEYDVIDLPDAEAGLDLFHKRGFDIALLDVKLPGMSGIELTQKLLEIDPSLPVVLITAFGGVDTAVEGMKAGAQDYLVKPIDLEELKIVIAKQIDNRKLAEENRVLREQIERINSDALIAESRQMEDILSMVSRVAPTDAPVLITGESGVGKELIARTIHDLSGRSGAFIPINCAALPANLLESELFGAEPGAYTGANKRMRGKIELADGGTLFLDEVAEIDLPLQPKLLRFLQEGSYFRLGGNALIAPSVRVISATNRDVRVLVEAGQMREDLYYRLAVISIEIPPLRERKDDLVTLADRLLERFVAKHGKPIRGLSKEARDALIRHPWPGNIRELMNTLERAVILSRTELITPVDLQIVSGGHLPNSELLADVERAHIRRVLDETDWHISNAADRLGIHRNTLRNKIAEYGLER
ncbi:MAG TPA: sigma-54-dependent Fis family transcriptional regulator [candidate division Zixibacteria bacterium]|nr:sigma-54-dependent Fis family transcriptional regulator [candidate division Zixibacteria bacterium]